MHHTNTIWSALCSGDLGECFAYSELILTTHKKFSTGVWSQSLFQISHRMIQYSGAWQSFRDLHFKNPLESHFSFNKKCFVSRTVLIQCVLHFSNLGECFTCSQRMLTTHRNLSTGFWSQSLRQKPTQKWQNILDFGRASETKCVFVFGEDFDFRSS